MEKRNEKAKEAALQIIFLEEGVLKICDRFTEEKPCRNMTLIKLLCSFIEIPLRHGSSPVNLLYIFRTPFYKNTFGGLFLKLVALEEISKNNDNYLWWSCFMKRVLH